MTKLLRWVSRLLQSALFADHSYHSAKNEILFNVSGTTSNSLTSQNFGQTQNKQRTVSRLLEANSNEIEIFSRLVSFRFRCSLFFESMQMSFWTQQHARATLYLSIYSIGCWVFFRSGERNPWEFWFYRFEMVCGVDSQTTRFRIFRFTYVAGGVPWNFLMNGRRIQISFGKQKAFIAFSFLQKSMTNRQP